MASTRYEIHIRGRLSASLLSSFSGLGSSVEPVRTVLCGDIEDQAELYGHLERIQALGLELVEVRRVAEPGPAR